MADKKVTMVAQLIAEAKAEMLKENRKMWIRQLKDKMETLARAKKVVKNCEREIEDLEMQINDELA